MYSANLEHPGIEYSRAMYTAVEYTVYVYLSEKFYRIMLSRVQFLQCASLFTNNDKIEEQKIWKIR